MAKSEIYNYLEISHFNIFQYSGKVFTTSVFVAVVCPCSNTNKYNPIVIKFLNIIWYLCGIFGTENKICITYGSFTETLKTLPLHYFLWGKPFNDITLF